MKLTLSAIKSLFRKYDRKMQRGIDGVKAYVDESVADWNQNDETALDYVKNRTHYEAVEKVLTDKVTCTAEYERPTGTYYCNLSGSAYYLQYKGDNGDTVYVVVDGVEYVCKQRGSLNSAETAYGYAIGNTALLEGDSFSDGFGNLEFEDTGEPFVFWVHNYYTPGTSIIFREQGEHTAEIRKNTIVTHPLDDKYIPDNIVRSEELNEAIDYVNRTLPRSDWNQNDGTQKDFILGRTHYTELRDFTYSVSITLDNSGGWMRKNDPDFAKALYDNWENATFTRDGSQNRIRRDSIEYNKNFMGSTVDFYAALENESGGNSVFLGINLTDGFVLIGEDSASWGSVHITFPVHEEIVHPLDEKYIPESIARKSDIPQGGGSADIPSTLPNPHPLTFTGAVEATYDGSTPVEVEIPMGGAGETWDVLANFKAEEDVANFLQTTPPDGHSFDEYTEFIVLLYVKPNSAGKTTYIKLSINNSMGYGGFFRFATGGIKDTTKKGRIEILHVRKTDAGWIPVFGGRSYNEDSMNNGIQFMPNLSYDVLTLNKQPNADPEDISTVMQTDKVKLIAIGGYETVLGAGSMAIVYGKRGA